MNATRDTIRKGVSLGLSLLLLGSSVVVPVLERADLVGEPVAESEHNPATCPSGHDHSVCTQVGANAPVPTKGHRHARQPRDVAVATPGALVTAAASALALGHPSRAPPLT